MRTFVIAILLGAAALSRAAYAPQDPASSLDALLRDVWEKGADNAYGLYMGKTRVPMSPAAHQAFAQQMLDLAQDPSVAGIILQKSKMEYYPKSHLPDPHQFDNAYFVHFMRANSKGDSIQERIYLNLHPDHAAEVMQFVVREILSRPGIVEAKVACPSGLETRADAMLIYAATLGDVDWALERLTAYQADHRGHFLADLPAATRPRLIGVSTAAQPANSSDSFGSYLARTAQAAIKQQPPPADFAEFRKRVRAQLTADGVDPDHPDRLTRRP